MKLTLDSKEIEIFPPEEISVAPWWVASFDKWNFEVVDVLATDRQPTEFRMWLWFKLLELIRFLLFVFIPRTMNINSHLFIPSIFIFQLVQLLFHVVSLDIYKFFTPKNIQRAQKNCSNNNKNEMKNTQERNNITISSRRSAQLDLTATLLLLISTVSICVLPILRWVYQFHSIAHAHTHTCPHSQVGRVHKRELYSFARRFNGMREFE